MSESQYAASWGVPLKLMTVFFFVLFGAIVAVMFSPLGSLLGWWRAPILVIPVVVGLVSALFMVRGYTVSPGTLGIRRLLWTTKFSLADFVSAQADPDALRASIRIFGNGGLFAFSGWYRNKKLGVYRAYITDASRPVVLRFTSKTLVVSPDETARFVSEITPSAPSI